MNRARAFALPIITAFTFLAGCATVQTGSTDALPAAERPQATSFELEGRISASDSERAANGTLLWERKADVDRWTVLTPLGQVVAEIIATPAGATLRSADGQQIQAADVNALLPQLLGISAPAEHLGHWVQAVPAPEARILQTDAQGRPQRIADSGWIIDYLAYRGTEPDAAPRRIDAHRGDARLRIVVDEWTPLD